MLYHTFVGKCALAQWISYYPGTPGAGGSCKRSQYITCIIKYTSQWRHYADAAGPWTQGWIITVTWPGIQWWVWQRCRQCIWRCWRYICVSFCLPACLPFCLCLSVSLSVRLSVSLSESFSLCPYIYMSVSLPHHLSLFLSLCLCVCLALSLSPFFIPVYSLCHGSFAHSLSGTMFVYFPVCIMHQCHMNAGKLESWVD